MNQKIQNVQIESLSNQIPVLFQPFEGLVASSYWWVRSGSADEFPETEAGFAHFLEHMLFKDADHQKTGQPSQGKVARVVESLGGEINAYTTFDHTVYHVTCAEQHWEKVFKTFSSMGTIKNFSIKDFEREREVILEEIRKNEDSPGRQLFQEMFSASFAKHPYGRPVIGYAELLKKSKLKALEAFFHRNYDPSRMGIILVGPFSPERKKSS